MLDSEQPRRLFCNIADAFHTSAIDASDNSIVSVDRQPGDIGTLPGFLIGFNSCNTVLSNLPALLIIGDSDGLNWPLIFEDCFHFFLLITHITKKPIFSEATLANVTIGGRLFLLVRAQPKSV